MKRLGLFFSGTHWRETLVYGLVLLFSTSHSLSAQPTASRMYLKKNEAVRGELQYWFSLGTRKATSPQPLPTAAPDGWVSLEIPSEYNQPQAQLEILDVNGNRIARLPKRTPSDIFQGQKEPPPNRLHNGTFNDGTSGWGLTTSGPNAVGNLQNRDESLTARHVEGKSYQITLPATNTTRDILLRTENIPLAEGDAYTVSFWAKADKPRTLQISTALAGNSKQNTGLDTVLQISEEWKKYQLEFMAARADGSQTRELRPRPVSFRYRPESDATAVFLAGSFTGWQDGKVPMTRLADGKTWGLTRNLLPGRHEYKFVVNSPQWEGDKWFPDPSMATERSDDGHGGVNSVLYVAAPDYLNSLTFALGGGAGTLSLASLSLRQGTATSLRETYLEKGIELNPDDFRYAAALQIPVIYHEKAVTGMVVALQSQSRDYGRFTLQDTNNGVAQFTNVPYNEQLVITVSGNGSPGKPFYAMLKEDSNGTLAPIELPANWTGIRTLSTAPVVKSPVVAASSNNSELNNRLTYVLVGFLVALFVLAGGLFWALDARRKGQAAHLTTATALVPTAGMKYPVTASASPHEAPPPGMAGEGAPRLIGIEGVYKDYSFPITNACTYIGRDTGNAIALLQDTGASRRHASVELIEGQYMIRDVGSANGIFINGSRLAVQKPYSLHPGDEIEIGMTTFRFEA